MAKRMTDTDKWKKPFIKSLPTEYKLFWLYLLDDCDHAGIWQVELEVANTRLGLHLSQKKILGFLAERIVEFDNGTKWFLPDFVSFQYGKLNPLNRAHLSVVSQLDKYELLKYLPEKIKGLGSPLQGAKDKDKDIVVSSLPFESIKADNEISQEEINFFSDQAFKEQFCMAKKIDMRKLTSIQHIFLNDLKLKGKPLEDLKNYFVNWYNQALLRGGFPKPPAEENSEESRMEKLMRAM